jgi:hypothetical protein
MTIHDTTEATDSEPTARDRAVPPELTAADEVAA